MIIKKNWDYILGTDLSKNVKLKNLQINSFDDSLKITLSSSASQILDIKSHEEGIKLKIEHTTNRKVKKLSFFQDLA